MNKKVVALAVALVLCLTCVSALAGASKTTQNVISTTTTSSDVSVVVAQPTAETKAILEEIAELANNNVSVAEYFGIEDIELADGLIVDELKVDELFPVILTGTVTGSATVTLSTAASYTEEDAVVVLVGIMVDGEMVWTQLECTVENGKLVVTIPEEIAAEFATGSVNLAVLSNKEDI